MRILRSDRATTKHRIGAILAVMTVSGLLAALLSPQATARPAAAVRPSPGEAYAAMGYGVFMHYGLATFVGQTPWNYEPEDVPATVYDPPNFDADQWMSAAKASGAKYVILTAKHHDGFALWPSDYSDYGVETSSDPDTDVVGEFVRAARARDLKVVLYYSWYDRLVPGGDVRPRDPDSDRTATPEYLAYAKNHLRELLTEYGPIAGLWLDIAPMDDVQLPELANFIHGLSPSTAFIPNFPNAIRDAHEAADVATFEGPMEMMPCGYRDKPAEQAYNVSAGPGWWQATENPPTRSAAEISALRSSVQAMDATLSLNVSPGPQGLIPPASVDLLEALGSGTHRAHARPAVAVTDATYDDGRDPCGADTPIEYVGAWSAGEWPGAYDDTRHYSNSPGAYAELAFEGTGVAVMTQTRPGHGIAAISVDGGAPELVDTYSDPAREQVIVWRKTGLPPGPHTVRITVTGDKNPAATNTWVALDAIVVTS